MPLAATLVLSATSSAGAQECNVLIGWSSKGQVIQDDVCGIHYVAKEDRFSDLELSGSRNYQFRFAAQNDSTKEMIVQRVGYLCDLAGSDRAVFTANRGNNLALVVSFSCGKARG